MKTLSSRDLEQLSAYLDGQLSGSSRTRLEIRIQSDPALASALADLRQTRAFLRRTPSRRAPRNFTLTPKMAGIRPPVPRLVPVLSWASAVAALFFIFTLGAGLVGQLSLGAATAVSMNFAAPMAAATAAPATSAPAAMAPVMAAPATSVPATMAPFLATTATPVPSASPATEVVPEAGSSNPSAGPVPTDETSIMMVEQDTPPASARAAQSNSFPKAESRLVNLWLFIWPGLAVLLGVLALLAQWLNRRNFHRKNPRG